jgi:hypothetical protein
VERKELDEAINKLNSGKSFSPESELILEIINGAKLLPISFEAIRKSRRWDGKPPEKQVLLESLQELIVAKKIAGSIDEGYTPLD